MTRIVQIAILVVLVVAGVGAYVMQQDGGLEAVFDRFKSESPPPQTAVPTAPKAPPKDKTPSIPSQPAHGTLSNTPFTVVLSEIEGGVLTLRAGMLPTDAEVTILLRTRPWEVPAGRSFRFVNATAAPDTPQIRVRAQAEGGGALRAQEFIDKYTLVLELGPEKDRRIAGKIYIELPDEGHSRIAGTFDAEVRGFRLVDGKPDLTSDSIDTLQFLALREMLRDDPDKPVEDAVFRRGRYDAAGQPPTGYIELYYRAGDSASATHKFQFVKEQNAWRVTGTLAPDQLAEAHPYRIPGPKDSPELLFPYLAAKRLEAEVRKRHAGRLVSAAEFAARHDPRWRIGAVDVRYRIDDGQPVRTSYLFRRGANGWTLVRELKKKERLNLATGKVETQR